MATKCYLFENSQKASRAAQKALAGHMRLAWLRPLYYTMVSGRVKSVTLYKPIRFIFFHFNHLDDCIIIWQCSQLKFKWQMAKAHQCAQLTIVCMQIMLQLALSLEARGSQHGWWNFFQSGGHKGTSEINYSKFLIWIGNRDVTSIEIWRHYIYTMWRSKLHYLRQNYTTTKTYGWTTWNSNRLLQGRPRSSASLVT